MKLYLICLVVLSVVVFSECGISNVPNAVNPAHPGKCYLNTNPPTIIPVGETVTIPGKCERAICKRNFEVEIHTCAAGTPSKGCKRMEPNGQRPYPECCPRVTCS